MTDLQEWITAAAKRQKWKGKRNYLFAYFLYLVAACSSGGATLWAAALAARRQAPSFWLALIAALPAVALLLNDTLQLEAKGRWCYEKRTQLLALLRSSRFEGIDDKSISSKWSDLDIKLEKSWPRFRATLPVLVESRA